MAVIVRANPYQSWMRKIGYSVGLEDILERVINLTELYTKEKVLTYALFQDLVANTFERGNKVKDADIKRATLEFANFYSKLNLVKINWKNIDVYNTLDTLSIMRRVFYNNDDAFRSAAKTIITQCILEADGDIFLNALAADFDIPQVKLLLEEMRKVKRGYITKLYKSPLILDKIYEIVDIESQPTNKGGLKEKQLGRLQRRKEPLDSTRRKESLSKRLNHEGKPISTDYLQKVTSTRKGWAKALDLFEGKQKTQKGNNLLNALSDLGFKYRESNAYIFWPYSSDLRRLRIGPEQIDLKKDLKPWDLICTIAKTNSSITTAIYDDKADYSEVVDELHNYWRLYKEGNAAIGGIRNQLPLYIVEPCIVAFSVGSSRAIPPLFDIISAERMKKRRRFQEIGIRGTEGGLLFSRCV